MRFYEKGEEPNREYWFQQEDLDMQLNEDNLIGCVHETVTMDSQVVQTADSIYDRVQVQDPRDERWFQFWRYNHGDEQFSQLEFIARRVGVLLCRQTAMEDVKDLFFQMHPVAGEAVNVADLLGEISD